MTEYSHEPHQAQHGSAPGGAYDVDSEINFRMLFAAGIGIAVTVIVACLVVGGFYYYFHHQLIREDPAPSPVAAANGIHLPPLPRIQPDPPADLAAMHAREDKVLYHFGWVDKAADVVHIPISDALRIYLQEHGTAENGSGGAQTPTPTGGSSNGTQSQKTGTGSGE